MMLHTTISNYGLGTKAGQVGVPLSTGWKLVSFLPSKPVPNSICGTLQEPKLPIADVPDEDAAAAVADAVPPTIFP
jgi:hypothetical protein